MGFIRRSAKTVCELLELSLLVDDQPVPLWPKW